MNFNARSARSASLSRWFAGILTFYIPFLRQLLIVTSSTISQTVVNIKGKKTSQPLASHPQNKCQRTHRLSFLFLQKARGAENVPRSPSPEQAGPIAAGWSDPAENTKGSRRAELRRKLRLSRPICSALAPHELVRGHTNAARRGATQETTGEPVLLDPLVVRARTGF
jgi:hypothetical protein